MTEATGRDRVIPEKKKKKKKKKQQQQKTVQEV
jgi:hypothetical protein